MKENWALWMQKLPSHWHLLIPDLPGLGESQYQPAASYRYERQAERLRDWLQVDPETFYDEARVAADLFMRPLRPGPRSGSPRTSASQWPRGSSSARRWSASGSPSG